MLSYNAFDLRWRFFDFRGYIENTSASSSSSAVSDAIDFALRTGIRFIQERGVDLPEEDKDAKYDDEMTGSLIVGWILSSILNRFQTWTALPWLFWHCRGFKLLRSDFCAVCQKLLFLVCNDVECVNVRDIPFWGVFSEQQKWNHNTWCTILSSRNISKS